MKPEQVSGLEPLINQFDLFLIDQFGVLHDGIAPYPGAINTLEKLKAKNKRVVVVSNSGKRASVNVSRLAKLGFKHTLFDNVITSGEVAFRRLATRLQGSSIKSCFLISRDNDRSAIEGLDLRLEGNAHNADIIIISASEAEQYSEEDYRNQLSKAAKDRVPCLCTNPDKKMLTSSGIQFGAGRIASIYEQLGGSVEWIGKPHPAIYREIFSLQDDYDTNRILCIGDSTEHDIAGGQSVDLSTLLVMTGINTDLTADELQRQFKKYNATPDFIAPELVY